MAWYDLLPGRSGPGVGTEIKGTPISTLSDAELLEKYGPMPQLEAGAVSETTGRAVLEPYYGENLDAEIAKAKAFDKEDPEAALPFMQRDPAFRSGAGVAAREFVEGQNVFFEQPQGRFYGDAYTIDYDKIDAPVKVKVESDPNRQMQAHYSSEDGITLNSPEFSAKRAANFSKDTRTTVQQYLDVNNKRQSDLEWEAANPRSGARETLEHEVGHHFTDAEDGAAGGVGHIGRPREMSNALGKIQRDAYVLYGQRFETPSQFADYVYQERDKPEAERFKGFSIEAKRGLRAIIDSDRKVRLQAINSIPKFVTAEPTPEPTFDDYLDYWQSRQVAS